MPKWLRTLLVPLAVLALVAAACGDDGGTDPGTDGETPECNADLSVGVAYDIGGIGDKSFNDAANAGLTAAIDEGLVCEENTDSLEPDATGSNRDDNVDRPRRRGPRPGHRRRVRVLSGHQRERRRLRRHPVRDHRRLRHLSGPHAGSRTMTSRTSSDLTFKEHEGSFLVGAAAATKADEDGCDTVGFLGGQTGPLIEKFEAGFEAGVAHVNDGIEVLVAVHRRRRDGFQRRGEGRGSFDGHVRRRRVHHLSRRRRLGSRTVQRGGRRGPAGDRRRLRPVPAGQRRTTAAHHDVDAEAGRHGRARRDPAGR